MRWIWKIGLVLLVVAFQPILAAAQRGESVLTGYVLLPDENQTKAKGIEVRVVSPTKVTLCAFTTEENGRFQRIVIRNQNMVSVFGCGSFPANLNVFFYVKLEGYGEVFQPWVRDGGNVIALLRGPSDGLDETRRETQPLTPSESLRKELVTQYGELAVRYYEAALSEKLKHNTEKAITNLNQAVKASSRFFEAWVELGDLLRQSKRLDPAEQAFRKAIALKPGAGEPYIDLGAVLLDKATGLADDGSADAATTVFKDAVEILKSASEKAPWSSDAYYYLGSAQYKLNQLADAEASLRTSLEKQDPRQDARLMLVNIYIKMNRLKEALEQVNAYLSAVPDSPQRAAVLDLQAKLQKEVKAP